MGIALPVGWTLWAASRIWVPLDIPVSLSRGHIRSEEFKINVESWYWVGVEVERGFDFNGAPCLLGYSGYICTGTPSVLKATWSVSSGGKVVAQGTSNVMDWMMFEDSKFLDRGIGAFNAKKGQHYVLDVDILEDGSRLNAGHPHLGLYEFGGLHREYNSFGKEVLPILTVLLIGAGAIVIVRSKRKKQDYRRVSLTEPGPARGGLCAVPKSSPTPPKPHTARKGWRLPATAWIGICLTILGLVSFAGIQGWMATRTFAPVDMPVSLAPGHIKTGPFRINLKGTYSIRINDDLIDLPDTYETWMGFDEIREFNAKCSTGSLPQTRWVLYRDGKVVDQSLSSGPGLMYFSAEKGLYTLDVEVLSDASCLNSQHPRLRVSTPKGDYTDSTDPLLLLSGLCGAIGISLLVLFGISRLRERSARTVSFALSASIGQYFQWARKFHLKKVFSGPPSFGLVTTFTLFVVWVPVVVLFNARIPPVGLKVYLATPKGLLMKVAPLTQPIVVELKYDDYSSPPNLYLNSRLVPLKAFAGELKNELKLRPDWVVYFEADPNVVWGEAVNVIDIIRGMPAEVVLLTYGVSQPHTKSPKAPAP